jgi:hypothetical protein
MDDIPSPIGGERDLLLDGGACANAARHLARERQKQELRRERDVIVLRIARDLGEQGMAERLGVGRPVVDKLLADARNRLDATASPPRGPEIAVRRLPPDGERFADADDHYEALGSASMLGGRLGAPPRF